MKPIFSLLVFLSLASLSPSTTAFKAVSSDEAGRCVYTIYVRTGDMLLAGTRSVIGVALAGSDGLKLEIPDLVSWGGGIDPGHYFERGSLDVFRGRGACLSEPPCWMKLTSDRIGKYGHDDWYCKYVNVTTTGPDVACARQSSFEVEQWLESDNKTYVIRDMCPRPGAAGSGLEEIMSRDQERAMRAGA